MSQMQCLEINTRFAEELDPEGRWNIFSCYQCKKCSSGCPMERDSDLHPHQIIRMVQMGRKDEALHSKGIWLCISCQTCVSRCPMNVNTPAVIDALRAAVARRETPRSVRKVPIFNRVFLELIRRLGRVYELGMMSAFKLGSQDLFTDIEKFPMMLRKGKLRLIPTLPGRRANLRRIFRATKKASGR
ncbi:MAG: 4Fe-4S dicluster domain-containing protein [bacterium]|nr:4Fe-4S dicluster domain-containing protein [bacterium]